MSNDGGTAFPSQENVHDSRVSGIIFTPGMTLRDYFAAKALNGMLSSPDTEPSIDMLCKCAYRIADAMLEARKP